MKKLMLILVLLSFLSFGCTTTKNSDSQEYSCTTELEWNTCDLKPHPIFQDTNQIIKWGKNLGSADIFSSKNIFIKNRNVFFLIAHAGNWFIYYSIDVFELKNGIWQFITSTNAKVQCPIKIKVDNEQEKILFKIDSTQIGELPFDIFDIKFDKTTE